LLFGSSWTSWADVSVIFSVFPRLAGVDPVLFRYCLLDAQNAEMVCFRLKKAKISASSPNDQAIIRNKSVFPQALTAALRHSEA